MMSVKKKAKPKPGPLTCRHKITVVYSSGLVSVYLGDKKLASQGDTHDPFDIAWGFTSLGLRVEVLDVKWESLPDRRQGEPITHPESLAYLKRHLACLAASDRRARIKYHREQLSRLEAEELDSKEIVTS